MRADTVVLSPWSPAAEAARFEPCTLPSGDSVKVTMPGADKRCVAIGRLQ